MILLVIGLALFIGTHSTRIVADGWRSRVIARIGAAPWKGLYSLLALAGLVLVVIGYGQARAVSADLWVPPVWMKHLAGLLTLVAFVLFAASHAPRSRIKARVHHPMVMGVKTWALAHLLANARVADFVLFGALLAWAIFDARAARQRDVREGKTYPPGTLQGDVKAVVGGLVAWALFAFLLHGWLIGVPPYAV